MVFTCLSLDYCISIKWLAIVWAAHPVYNGHLNRKHHTSLVCTIKANIGEGDRPQFLFLYKIDWLFSTRISSKQVALSC